MVAIANFDVQYPPYFIEQQNALEWLSHLHTRAEASLLESCAFDATSFQQKIKAILMKIGLGSEKVQKRYVYLSDVLCSSNWDQMAIFRVHEQAQGKGIKDRMALFDKNVVHAFEKFYPSDSPLPSHLIHVTCTGYVAPSGAQRLVSQRKGSTSITHAYHMGCYASIPSLRIGGGYLAAHPREQVDIVHTELCSLHMNPTKHEVEQLVIQSLFGDGCIKYSLLSTEMVKEPHLRLLQVHEELIPDTAGCMSWACAEWGMNMTLSKDTPLLISRALPFFLENLGKKAGLSSKKLCKEAFFAIHPGGPKIIEQTAKLLQLENWQIADSREVLTSRGNMSSATLPHIWKQILEKSTTGQQVVSVAFGPGLTICGALFVKQD